jgi:hypothetical protein
MSHNQRFDSDQKALAIATDSTVITHQLLSDFAVIAEQLQIGCSAIPKRM